MKLKNIVSGKIKADTKCKKKELGICGICNEERECYSDAWSSNFTNHEDVSSLLVCDECLPLLNSDYRKRSFYITEKEAKTIAQSEFYDILHNLEFPCILSFTDSNKKHRLFRSVISYRAEELHLVLDDTILTLSVPDSMELLHTLHEFYNKYKISKSWIVNGDYPVGAIKKIGISEFMKYENIIKPYRGTDILFYLVKFINKNDG